VIAGKKGHPKGREKTSKRSNGKGKGSVTRKIIKSKDEVFRTKKKSEGQYTKKQKKQDFPLASPPERGGGEKTQQPAWQNT